MSLMNPKDRRVKQTKMEIINLKIMVQYSPDHQMPFYTVALGSKHTVQNETEAKRFFATQRGRYMLTNLIEALTQDDVLDLLSPCKRKVVSS